MTVFYKLPADLLQEGLSTDDGQDIIDVTDDDGYVYATVYTPSDDPDEDNERRCAPETRIYSHDELVDLAVFAGTQADLSGHPLAVEPRADAWEGS